MDIYVELFESQSSQNPNQPAEFQLIGNENPGVMPLTSRKIYLI